MSQEGVQGGALQLVAAKSQTGGRKRRRAREVADFIRREIPEAFMRSGDLERVAEDYGVAKIEVLAETLLWMRKGPQPARRAFPIVARRIA